MVRHERHVVGPEAGDTVRPAASPAASGKRSRARSSSTGAGSSSGSAVSSERIGSCSELARHSTVEALLDAAGIEGLDPSSEAAQTLGAMLRAAVGGMMEVLRARERMKDELRVTGTTFKVANNNPLKFPRTSTTRSTTCS